MRQKIAFWRPNRKGTGAAAILEFDVGRDGSPGIFFSMMPQRGERNFNSDAKIVSMLGLTDIGEILATISGRQDGCGQRNEDGKFKGLYHQSRNEGDYSVISFTRGDQGGYFLGLSTRRGSDDFRYHVRLSEGEAEQLAGYFNAILPHFFEEEEYQGGNSNESQRETVGAGASSKGDNFNAGDDSPF